MTRFVLQPFRTTPLGLVLLAGLMISSSATYAQSVAPPPLTQPALSSGDTVRLSDEERASIMDAQTEDSVAAARGEMVGSDRNTLGIHGEVGAMIGSNGTRGAYGTAAIPLGDHAGAVVSFESSQFGHR